MDPLEKYVLQFPLRYLQGSVGKKRRGVECRRKEKEMNTVIKKLIDIQSLDEATVSAILNEKLTNLDFKKQKYLLKV